MPQPDPDMNPGDEAAPGTAGTGEDVCPDCHGSGQLEGAQCETCGGTDLVLDTVMGARGIFCRVCPEGQWHWDCPKCGQRQDFAASFFYNEKAVRVSCHSTA